MNLRWRSVVVAVLLVPLAVWAGDRSIDGTGNNLANPEYGSVDVRLERLAGTDYADGISDPAGPTRPSARLVSNLVADQPAPLDDGLGASGYVLQWGQFLDHDIDLTEGADEPEAFPIAVPLGDAFFGPDSMGAVIFLFRSAFDSTTGTSEGNPREQINQVTAFIDGSGVYGSDPDRASFLRTGQGGRLKTSLHDLLPFNTSQPPLPNAGSLPGREAELYVAGDVRANEQVGLTALHTLFVREHNRRADEISSEDPALTDEEVYQRARAIVGALIQVITYEEFLPVLLGPEGTAALGPYDGYSSDVNPGIINEFSTAAYRFGHSALPAELLRLKKNGKSVPQGPLPLRDAFFNPEELLPRNGKGIEPLLRGFAVQPIQEIDNQVVDDVRNFLFGDPGEGGFDLAALNIQRGRDHGLPAYDAVRIARGLPAAGSFSAVSSDPVVQANLELAYGTGNVGEIDLWVGGLAEDPLSGGLLGPLFSDIVVEQFERLRAGDRFWYENDPRFTPEEVADLKRTTLADVIVWISSGELQDNVFRVP